MRLSILIIFLFVSICLNGQKITSKEVIENSIHYHDPDGDLNKKKISLYFTETRPSGDDRKSSVSFNIAKETFQMRRKTNNNILISSIKSGVVSHTKNGSVDISEEDKKKFRLDDKRTRMMKNYYEYLWLMPHKINDPGSIIEDEVKLVDFFGNELLEVKVTYDKNVGNDIWYFYFHPESYALSGYRFYHEEAKNDGEYILLKGETQNGKIKIPKARTWYTHKEDKLLGTDILDEIKIK